MNKHAELTVVLMLLTIGVCSAQLTTWDTSPLYVATEDVQSEAATYEYYPQGYSIGPVDLDTGNRGPIDSPINTFKRFFNADEVTDIANIFADSSSVRRYTDQKLNRTISNRNEGHEIFVQSILYSTDELGQRLAYLKFFVEIPTRERPLFGLKVFKESEGSWKITQANLIRGVGIAVLSFRSDILFETLTQERPDQLGVFDGEHFSIVKFSNLINTWLTDPERYAKESETFLQNLGWL